MAEKNNKEIMVLWSRKGSKGTNYLHGKLDLHDGKISKQIDGFYNTKKKNPKEPDVRIYAQGNDGKLERDAILSLWCNVSSKGNKFLTGTFEGKRVVGFINTKATEENKQPKVTIQFSDEKPQPKAEEPKEQMNIANDDLPF